MGLLSACYSTRTCRRTQTSRKTRKKWLGNISVLGLSLQDADWVDFLWQENFEICCVGPTGYNLGCLRVATGIAYLRTTKKRFFLVRGRSRLQWSNYSIIYEGGRKIWRAIASLEKKFLRPPEAPPEVTFRGIKMFFYCNFNTKKHCNKASIKKSSAHHRNCSPLNRPTPDFCRAIWPFR